MLAPAKACPFSSKGVEIMPEEEFKECIEKESVKLGADNENSKLAEVGCDKDESQN